MVDRYERNINFSNGNASFPLYVDCSLIEKTLTGRDLWSIRAAHWVSYNNRNRLPFDKNMDSSPSNHLHVI